MNSFIDHLNNPLHFRTSPTSIVSLVPSITELLFDMGLGPIVVGVTKYCVHPDSWIAEKTVVGGTKDVQLHIIHKLKPDLILANKEENTKEQIEELQRDYPVYVSDINTLADATDFICTLGAITNKDTEAQKLVWEINQAFDGVKLHAMASVLYLIWRKPFIAVGGCTFIDFMLRTIGLTNAVQQERYPLITAEEIIQLRPDYIFLSSEPFPFSEKHVPQMRQLSPYSEAILVDGEMFSWYGSRLRYAPSYFNALPLR